MSVKLATIARRAALAAVAFAVCAFAACALALPAWGAEPSAQQGDSSQEGNVVQHNTNSQGGSGAQPADGQSASGQDAPASGDAPAQEPSPQPLDAQDNAINEGQVSDSSFLYDAAIADLAGADSYYDGQTVQVTGEAVGEAIKSLGEPGGEDNVRVTLYEASSGSSITACMSAGDADKIKMFGAYGKTGSIVRVQGTFNLTCKQHDGESDIHADVVTVVQQGSDHPDELDPKRFIPGFAAVGVGLVLMLVFWRIKERSR